MRVFSERELDNLEHYIKHFGSCPPGDAVELIDELRWRKNDPALQRKPVPAVTPGLTRCELALLAGVLLGLAGGIVFMMSTKLF